MTVSSTTNRVSYLGNGVSTAFAVSFPFQGQADLVVLLTTIADGTQTTEVLNSDYTISGTTDANGFYPDGGMVNAVTAPPSTKSITIYRDPLATQTTEYVDNDPLPAADLQGPMDKAVMLIQRVKDLISRALVQPDGDTATIGRMPAKVNRASMFLAFDSNGDPIAAAGTSADLGPVSAYIDTLLDDTDAATARTTLGLASGATTTVGTAASQDTTFFWSTGDVKITLKTTADAGWVFFDDGTIGDASSGATTRANADTSDLFTLLWNGTTNANCAVSSGRGASAAADFAAHKTIALPKVLGRALATTGAGSGLTSRALADTVGAETHLLTSAEIPAPTPATSVLSTVASGASVGQIQTGAGANMYVEGIGYTGTDHVSLMQPTSFFNVMVKL